MAVKSIAHNSGKGRKVVVEGSEDGSVTVRVEGLSWVPDRHPAPTKDWIIKQINIRVTQLDGFETGEDGLDVLVQEAIDEREGNKGK